MHRPGVARQKPLIPELGERLWGEFNQSKSDQCYCETTIKDRCLHCLHLAWKSLTPSNRDVFLFESVALIPTRSAAVAERPRDASCYWIFLSVTQGYWKLYHSKAWVIAVSYSHSTIIMIVSCIISEIKRDIGRKSQFFHTPCFRRPV